MIPIDREGEGCTRNPAPDSRLKPSFGLSGDETRAVRTVSQTRPAKILVLEHVSNQFRYGFGCYTETVVAKNLSLLMLEAMASTYGLLCSAGLSVSIAERKNG